MTDTKSDKETGLIQTPDAQKLPVDMRDFVRNLLSASINNNTRRAYRSALKGYDQWCAANAMDESDAALAAYLGYLDSEGRAPASANTVVAAARMRDGETVGELTRHALRGFQRGGRSDRGRGQSDALSVDDLAAMMAVATRPRRRGRGLESAATAARRALVDTALVGVLFHCGLRRSEAADLLWRDVSDSRNADLMRVVIRYSKTNQDGSFLDVRVCKGRVAQALRDLRAVSERDGADVDDYVFNLRDTQINHRIKRLARDAGITGRITAHSARIGLASTLTARGASLQEVMQAGNWKTAEMVSHYSAGARAEQGAVAKYL